MDERELLEKIKERDEECLGKLIAQYEKYISSVVFRVIGSTMTQEDIQEVINDTFYSVWQYTENINLEKGSLKAYLTAIARNKAKNKLRAYKGNVVTIQETDYIDTTDFYEEIEKKEKANILREVLNMLKADEREIMIGYYFLYETTEEIASEMEIRRNTVKSKLSRGRKKLEIILRERGICQ